MIFWELVWISGGWESGSNMQGRTSRCEIWLPMYGVQESREIVRIDIDLVEAQDWGKVSSILA